MTSFSRFACVLAAVAFAPACGSNDTSPTGLRNDTASASTSATGAGGSGGGSSSGGSGGASMVDSSNSCGHAHNDYEHAMPLYDALNRGFCSVEADIFVVGNDLLVAHTLAATDPSRTLVSLYLDPLRQLAGQGKLTNAKGGIGPHGGPLQLLIDVKTDAAQTYAVLDPLLASYSDIMTAFDMGTVKPRKVTAVISGNRDQATMAAQTLRYAAIDGRIGTAAEQVPADTPTSLVPLLSQDWLLLFAWSGKGTFSAADRAKLDGYVAEAHGAKRILRFWDTVDTTAVWDQLVGAQVDLINVDDLAAFQAYKAAHDGAH